MSIDVSLNNKIKIKDIAVTMPKTLHNTEIFMNEQKSHYPNLALLRSDELDFSKFLTQQHSLIKAWFVCSAGAICLLSMLLFSAV